MFDYLKPDFMSAVKTMIDCLGDNVEREGLSETPERVWNSYQELFSGYGQNVEEVLKEFDNEGYRYGSIVLLKDIEFYSTCEHHMLPFFGKAHVAYIPGTGGKIVGVSKLARVLEIYSRRLQVQERIGEQVTQALIEHLKCSGAACIIEARHLCVCARGVSKQHSVMTTASMKGAFWTGYRARAELMTYIK